MPGDRQLLAHLVYAGYLRLPSVPSLLSSSPKNPVHAPGTQACTHHYQNTCKQKRATRQTEHVSYNYDIHTLPYISVCYGVQSCAQCMCINCIFKIAKKSCSNKHMFTTETVWKAAITYATTWSCCCSQHRSPHRYVVDLLAHQCQPLQLLADSTRV